MKTTAKPKQAAIPASHGPFPAEDRAVSKPTIVTKLNSKTSAYPTDMIILTRYKLGRLGFLTLPCDQQSERRRNTSSVYSEAVIQATDEFGDHFHGCIHWLRRFNFQSFWKMVRFACIFTVFMV